MSTADVRETAEIDALSTEGLRPELAELDQWPGLDVVRSFVDDQRAAVEAVAAAQGAIADVAEAIATRMRRGGRLIYVGAGTGGRMAVVDAVEIGPTFGLRDRVIAVLAGGVEAIVTGREFTEDEADVAAAEVNALMPGPDDAVLGVSASGRTPYVLGGIEAARPTGALTIGFACTRDSPLARLAECAIEVVTGPEIVAGSTRLKAGTAQKIVLNAISTLVMLRLGRTYGNLMVDVVADNAKLHRRALRIVVQATGVEEPVAAIALEKAAGRAKVAVVALLAGVSSSRAEELLLASAGDARKAVSLADARD